VRYTLDTPTNEHSFVNDNDDNDNDNDDDDDIPLRGFFIVVRIMKLVTSFTQTLQQF
jgi:hypothetical protein